MAAAAPWFVYSHDSLAEALFRRKASACASLNVHFSKVCAQPEAQAECTCTAAKHAQNCMCWVHAHLLPQSPVLLLAESLWTTGFCCGRMTGMLAATTLLGLGRCCLLRLPLCPVAPC